MYIQPLITRNLRNTPQTQSLWKGTESLATTLLSPLLRALRYFKPVIMFISEKAKMPSWVPLTPSPQKAQARKFTHNLNLPKRPTGNVCMGEIKILTDTFVFFTIMRTQNCVAVETGRDFSFCHYTGKLSPCLKNLISSSLSMGRAQHSVPSHSTTAPDFQPVKDQMTYFNGPGNLKTVSGDP